MHNTHLGNRENSTFPKLHFHFYPRRQFQRITGDSYVASILSRHLAFLQGRPDEMSEDEDNIDDDTGSDIIEEKLTSSQSKTRSSPNIVGMNSDLETRLWNLDSRIPHFYSKTSRLVVVIELKIANLILTNFLLL